MVDNLDNGQLNVKLDTIITQLESLARNMVTKDVFDVWKEGNGDRITRLETDLQKFITESTAVHVTLDKDSKARHAETEADIETLRVATDNRFQKQDDRNFATEEALKTSRSNRVVQWGIAAFGAAFAVIAPLVVVFVTKS